MLQASEETHNRVVGYVCHELRNPLHVVTTTCTALADETPATIIPRKERKQIINDMLNALEQMQCTVDDVLDFRAVCFRVCD